MKSILAISFSALLCWTGNALAQPAIAAAADGEAETCDVPELDQPCPPAAYRALELQMNALYKRHLTLLWNTVDEARMRDTQRAWLLYVEADCLFEVGSAESPDDFSTAGRRCRAAHLTERTQRLKRQLYCTSPECEYEMASDPLPEATTTLLLGRPSVLTGSAGALRRRPTGALVPFKNGDTVQPGDLLLFRMGSGFQVNNKTIGGKREQYWLRVQ